jgi:hypothetical protein
MIRFDCPHCGKTLRAPEESSGKKAKCSGCGKGVVVPPPTASASDRVPLRSPPAVKEKESLELSAPPEDEFTSDDDADQEFEIVENEPTPAAAPPRIPPPIPPGLARPGVSGVPGPAIDKSYPALRFYISLVRSFAKIAFYVYAGLVAIAVIAGTVFAFAVHGGFFGGARAVVHGATRRGLRIPVHGLAGRDGRVDGSHSRHRGLRARTLRDGPSPNGRQGRLTAGADRPARQKCARSTSTDPGQGSRSPKAPPHVGQMRQNSPVFAPAEVRTTCHPPCFKFVSGPISQRSDARERHTSPGPHSSLRSSGIENGGANRQHARPPGSGGSRRIDDKRNPLGRPKADTASGSR